MFNAAGHAKVMQTPGSTQGETNGLYAAVTVNEIVSGDEAYEYLEDNDSGLWGGFDRFLGGLGRVIDRSGDLVDNVNRTRYRYQNPVAPTVEDEWSRIGLFEKIAIGIAVGALAVALFRK